MSPETTKLNLNEAQEPQIPNPKEEWFDAYLEGNMRVPQTGFGIELFLLDSVLRDTEPDLQRLVESELTTEQLKKMRNAMNAAHAPRHIPTRSPEQINEAVDQIKRETGKSYSARVFEVPDSQLKYLWHNFIIRIFSLLRRILNKSRILSDIGASDNEIIEAIKNSPDALEKLKRLASVGVEALKSEEGKRLASKYRDIFNLKKHGQPDTSGKDRDDLYYLLNERAENTRTALLGYIVGSIVEKHPDLNDYISPEVLAG